MAGVFSLPGQVPPPKRAPTARLRSGRVGGSSCGQPDGTPHGRSGLCTVGIVATGSATLALQHGPVEFPRHWWSAPAPLPAAATAVLLAVGEQPAAATGPAPPNRDGEWSGTVDRRASTSDRGVEVEFTAADAFQLERLGRSFETVVDCGLLHTFDCDERPGYLASLASVAQHDGTLPTPDRAPSAKRR